MKKVLARPAKKIVKVEISGIKTQKDIVTVDISKVKLWKDNPRKNEKAIPKLAEVIKERGQITPIVVWSKNDTVYKGNTTIKALKLLGIKTVKVLYADFPSESAAIAYGIADNKSSEWSQWDDGLLENFLKLETIKDHQIGFDAIELSLLKDRIIKSNEIDFTNGAITENECPKCGYKW